MPALPFKLNQDRRHHIPKQKHKVMNWREYDAGLRKRGSLTVWFTEEAIPIVLAWPMDASPGGCSTPPPGHIDAVGGRPHHQGGGTLVHPGPIFSSEAVRGMRWASLVARLMSSWSS
jgi:hypothetical protein